jgi:hypothetical protein
MREVEVKLHSFLNSVVAGGELSDSRVSRFIPRQPVHSGWAPRAGLETVRTRKCLPPAWREAVVPLAVTRCDSAFCCRCKGRAVMIQQFESKELKVQQCYTSKF